MATERGGDALKTQLVYIYEAIHCALRMVTNRRIDTVFLPLLGAGKGGVPTLAAYSALVSAVFEFANGPGGHHLKRANIVVFEGQKGPEIEPAVAQDVLSSIARSWRYGEAEA